MAGVLLLAALIRIFTSKAGRAERWWLFGIMLLVALAVWSNALLPLKFYPVLVNVAMLAGFSYSLAFPPTAIERIARLSEPDLPPAAIAYTRRVTQVWCAFFIVNGGIAVITALWASQAVWALYNGAISYVLMGLLFAGEYLVRMRFKRRHNV